MEYLIIKNRKGNAIIEMLLVLIVVLVVSLVGMFSYKALNDMTPSLKEEFTNNQSIEVLDDANTSMPSFVDGMVVFLLVGLWIATIVFAFVIDTHPVFFVISVILLFIVLFCVAVLGNFYEELTEDPDLSDTVVSFPATNWIMSNLLIIGIVIGFSILIVLYGKMQRG